MRRRLYVICPNLQAAQKTMNDLLLARIPEGRIHTLARRDAPMDGLHEANVLQKTDIVHGAELGLVIGAVGGLALGVALVLLPWIHYDFEPVTILLTTLGGALFGSWVASLVAASVPNSHLLAFEKEIQDGKYLMMVDVPYRRVDDVEALVRREHPEDRYGGIEPNLPAFP
ncbi:MAG: DUF1269 domain-containing protein [Betaproteobacteria bacterium]|nr:DUF1269 domain-containing protein [Betaproteobacteria bacterium]